MRTRLAVGTMLVAFCGVATYLVGARETWGLDVAVDPNNKSGRPSVCKVTTHPGDRIATRETSSPPRAAGRGSEQSISYSFDGRGIESGVIDICSEYGSIELVGGGDGAGRIDVVSRNPFPFGDRALNDTTLATEVRRDGNRLYVAVRQLTQGVTSFRSWFARGSRPTSANVRITLPRQAEYLVHLVANHHYMSVRDLAIGGSFEGNAAPGVAIDAELVEPLTVRVSGTTYHGAVTDDPAVAAVLARGGSTIRLRLRRSTTVSIAHEQEGDVEVVLVDADAGVDVTARSPRPTIALGPAAESRPNADTVHARTTGFEQARVQVTVGASSATGAVVVRKVSG